MCRLCVTVVSLVAVLLTLNVTLRWDPDLSSDAQQQAATRLIGWQQVTHEDTNEALAVISTTLWRCRRCWEPHHPNHPSIFLRHTPYSIMHRYRRITPHTDRYLYKHLLSLSLNSHSFHPISNCTFIRNKSLKGLVDISTEDPFKSFTCEEPTLSLSIIHIFKNQFKQQSNSWLFCVIIRSDQTSSAFTKRLNLSASLSLMNETDVNKYF